ncbi:MAG: hypothetical protein PHZ02_15045 [Desulfocapsaceae bacterium]|nr:hypothetical protein [Desulfocapsaceae bacterium]
MGPHFAPTQSVEVSFQEDAVPKSCQGFAHLIASTAAPVSGKDIQDAIIKEAREKGANHVLIGMAREELGNKQDVFRFDYFGPEYPYPYPQGWMGWKFGIQEWEKAGPLIGFGLNNWEEQESRYAFSLMIQAAFLRCQ